MRATFGKLYLLKFFSFYLGCVGCFLLQFHFGFTPIAASSLLGVLITFVPLPLGFDHKGIQIAFCTGTFAGMSSPQILSDHRHVLLVSLLGAALYLSAKPYFKGIGGKMGAIAFLSTCLWLLLRVFA